MPDDSRRSLETERLHVAYAARHAKGLDRIYDPLTAAGRWGHLEAERHLLEGLAQIAPNLDNLLDARILEIGCGSGGHLIRLASWGIPPGQLSGIDLIPERIAAAQARHSGIDFRLGDASQLPWDPESFDLVLQFTCFSSILDSRVRLAVGEDIRRVLKPGGAVMSFDFTWNPTNKDTVGIGLKELRRMFPGARMTSRMFFFWHLPWPASSRDGG